MPFAGSLTQGSVSFDAGCTSMWTSLFCILVDIACNQMRYRDERAGTGSANNATRR